MFPLQNHSTAVLQQPTPQNNTLAKLRPDGESFNRITVRFTDFGGENESFDFPLLQNKCLFKCLHDIFVTVPIDATHPLMLVRAPKLV